MNLRILIAIISVLVLVLPLTHYKAYKHGRVTMDKEHVRAVDKTLYMLNGKRVYLEPVRQDNVCGNCHEGRV